MVSEVFEELMHRQLLTPKRKKERVASEFFETLNQPYCYANFLFCTLTFPAGDSDLRQFFSAGTSQTP